MSECSHCHEVLASPLACGACETLFSISGELSPFDVFGITPAARLDRSALRKRLLELQRLMHPDFHGQAGETLQGIAEHNTAELNAAFEVLRDEAKHASYLVEMLGGPSESDERQMPQAFLMEVMEWNETLEELKSELEGDTSRVAAQLDDFRAELNLERARLIESILDALEAAMATPDSTSLSPIRQELNAVRYIDRALDEANQIRLAAEIATR
jgi:molecular chaperone HscB